MTKISFFHRILDTISPQSCAICGKRLGITESVLCGVCNLNLPRTYFQNNLLYNEMAKNLWGKMPIKRAMALFYYQVNAPQTKIIIDFKYHNRPEYAFSMGVFIAKELQNTDFFNGIDVIIPVPLTVKRMKERGYNQSEEMAKGIASVINIPIETKILERKRFVESQTHKNRILRVDNTKDAFNLKTFNKLTNKHVLIIDDVFTTGSTICACADALMQDNVNEISVLTLAYTES